MLAQILCYKKSGIHWYHWHPTFLWKFNFTLVRRLISALIWDISGLWNRLDGRDFREKRIVISRFLMPYQCRESFKWAWLAFKHCCWLWNVKIQFSSWMLIKVCWRRILQILQNTITVHRIRQKLFFVDVKTQNM